MSWRRAGIPPWAQRHDSGKGLLFAGETGAANDQWAPAHTARSSVSQICSVGRVVNREEEPREGCGWTIIHALTIAVGILFALSLLGGPAGFFLFFGILTILPFIGAIAAVIFIVAYCYRTGSVADRRELVDLLKTWLHRPFGKHH